MLAAQAAVPAPLLLEVAVEEASVATPVEVDAEVDAVDVVTSGDTQADSEANSRMKGRGRTPRHYTQRGARSGEASSREPEASTIPAAATIGAWMHPNVWRALGLIGPREWMRERIEQLGRSRSDHCELFGQSDRELQSAGADGG